jgi:hypothetical protein
VGPAIGNAIFAAVGAWLRQPTHPSGHRARSTHAREASAMKALTTIVAGPPWRWRFVAVFMDELLHSGERLRRVLWSDNFPDRCRNFPVTRLKIPCLASTGNFVFNPLNFLVDWTEESPSRSQFRKNSLLISLLIRTFQLSST